MVEAVWGVRWWTLAVVVGGAAVWGGAWWWWLGRARVMLSDRTVVALVPAAGFDPSPEEIDRHAARLARVPAVVGWAPRRAMAVRLRLSSTQSQLSYRLEGPSQAAALLQLQDFADVDVVDPYASHEAPRIRFEGAPPLPKKSHVERAGA
ncbi:hypothetical protein EDD95_8073 [Streptomyces sp. CEV 2-1]|nr:hypothetical protein EDD95_8073 [Streptomyces sp. CEV 2-1]